MTLLESYKNRLAISESVHQKSHNGAKMSAGKKLMIASVLDNTARFMNEAFDQGAATQRSVLGDFKRFCLNISTVALPNLILPELMLTQPMTSITGYVTYLRYAAGTTIGNVEKDTTFATPYSLGKMDADRAGYTKSGAAKIVENVTAGEEFAPAWTPVTGSVRFFVDGAWVAADDTATVPEGATKVAYEYDNNIVVPQNTAKIATLKAAMNGIALRAHARRIAVYYSQIAAFQAKTDYGFDLGEQLATQAQGELAYEIDTEGVLMLVNGAELDPEVCFDSFDTAYKTVGATHISRSQYYEQFSEVLAKAKKVIYQRTQKFAPNFMICGANILTILPYLKGWSAAPTSVINGPYFAGTVDGLKVFVSPAMEENDFVFGVNGSDLQTAAAVYAPYMAIVPTQLLGFADGGMSQGFSTMYDMKLLSTYNRSGAGTEDDPYVRTDIHTDSTKDGDTVEAGQFSWLLVKGTMR